MTNWKKQTVWLAGALIAVSLCTARSHQKTETIPLFEPEMLLWGAQGISYDIRDNASNPICALAKSPPEGRWIDFEHDGWPELLTDDPTFPGYGPRIILRLLPDGSLTPDMELLRRASPYMSVAQVEECLPEWAQAARQSRVLIDPDAEGTKYDIPFKTNLWYLAYVGRWDLVERYVQLAWPEGEPGKERFLQNMISRMKESPYWPLVREMNPGLKEIE